MPPAALPGILISFAHSLLKFIPKSNRNILKDIAVHLFVPFSNEAAKPR